MDLTTRFQEELHASQTFLPLDGMYIGYLAYLFREGNFTADRASGWGFERVFPGMHMHIYWGGGPFIYLKAGF